MIDFSERAKIVQKRSDSSENVPTSESPRSKRRWENSEDENSPSRKRRKHGDATSSERSPQGSLISPGSEASDMDLSDSDSAEDEVVITKEKINREPSRLLDEETIDEFLRGTAASVEVSADIFHQHAKVALPPTDPKSINDLRQKALESMRRRKKKLSLASEGEAPIISEKKVEPQYRSIIPEEPKTNDLDIASKKDDISESVEQHLEKQQKSHADESSYFTSTSNTSSSSENISPSAVFLKNMLLSQQTQKRLQPSSQTTSGQQSNPNLQQRNNNLFHPQNNTFADSVRSLLNQSSSKNILAISPGFLSTTKHNPNSNFTTTTIIPTQEMINFDPRMMNQHHQSSTHNNSHKNNSSHHRRSSTSIRSSSHLQQLQSQSSNSLMKEQISETLIQQKLISAPTNSSQQNLNNNDIIDKSEQISDEQPYISAREKEDLLMEKNRHIQEYNIRLAQELREIVNLEVQLSRTESIRIKHLKNHREIQIKIKKLQMEYDEIVQTLT